MSMYNKPVVAKEPERPGPELVGKYPGLILMLVSVVVPAVSAEEAADQIESPTIGDPEGMEIVRHSHALANSIFNSRDVTYDWTAGTNIWHSYTDIYSDHYATSRDQDAWRPFDIDTIGVRGRVWEEGYIRFDQTETNQQSSDTVINYETTGSPYAHWYARSDHTFEYPENEDYWYPMTEDEFNE